MSGISIDTVTFDLWFTLISHDDLYDGRIRESRMDGMLGALRAAGVDVSMERLSRAYDDSGTILDRKWSASLDMDTDEQLATILSCLGVAPTPQLIGALDDPYANAVLRVEPFLVEGAREALEHCKEKGYRLALISNTSRTPGRALRKAIDKMGILKYFDVTVFSNEVGYQKPHPRIFDTALARLGSSRERAVHVGDHDVLDIRGAREYGMRSVWVRRYAGSLEPCCPPDVCIEALAELPGALARLGG
jgi:putative hydrolase of the HAD superfamily